MGRHRGGVGGGLDNIKCRKIRYFRKGCFGRGLFGPVDRGCVHGDIRLEIFLWPKGERAFGVGLVRRVMCFGRFN